MSLRVTGNYGVTTCPQGTKLREAEAMFKLFDNRFPTGWAEGGELREGRVGGVQGRPCEA